MAASLPEQRLIHAVFIPGEVRDDSIKEPDILCEIVSYPETGREAVRGINLNTGEKFFPDNPLGEQFYRLRTNSQWAWKRLTGEELPTASYWSERGR